MTSGSASRTGFYYNGNASSTSVTNQTSGSNASIAASNDIIAYGAIFAVSSIATSDIRIKNNINPIDITRVRSILHQLKPKTFGYIDTVKHSTLQVYGFIAQEVNDVLMSAVRLRNEYIPSIYEIADVINGTTVTLKTKNTSVFNCDTHGNDASGNPVKLKYYNTEDREFVTEITSVVDDTTFTVKDPIEYSSVFVFGHEINDYHGLDKDDIFTITTAVVQDIDQIVQTQQTQIQEAKQTIQELQSQLATVLARLSAAGIA
jgi:hypothetical protein